MAPVQPGPEAVARQYPHGAARLRPSAGPDSLELVALGAGRRGQAARQGKRADDDWH